MTYSEASEIIQRIQTGEVSKDLIVRSQEDVIGSWETQSRLEPLGGAFKRGCHICAASAAGEVGGGGGVSRLLTDLTLIQR